MQNNILRFTAFFTLHAAVPTSILTVVPLKVYALLGDLKLVSTVFFGAGLVTVLSRFLVPGLIRKYSYIGVFVGAVVLSFLAAAFMATDYIFLFLPALALFGAAVAAIEIVLTLLVLGNIPRLQLTKFEQTRLFFSAIPWTIGPWLGTSLKVHVHEKAPFFLTMILAMILLMLVFDRSLKKQPEFVETNLDNFWSYGRRYFAQPRLRLAWLLAFGKSAWWATYFTYVPIFAVLVGYGENIGGLMVTAGTACVWALPFWSWLAARVYMRRLVVSGFLSTALLSIVAAALIGYRPWMAAILIVLAAGLATSIDAAGNTLFLRAVRSKDRLEMAPVFATFRDTAQFGPQILFATLLVVFPLAAVFTAIGCMMLGMAAIAKKIPRSF
jgi:MFS transporter, ACDE family, multidrug resistance protein